MMISASSSLRFNEQVFLLKQAYEQYNFLVEVRAPISAYDSVSQALSEADIADGLLDEE